MAYNATNPNGQATGANSAPVVIASDNVVDTAGNNNVTTGSITAADTASTNSAGQGGQVLWTGTPTAASAVLLTFPIINGTPESQTNVVIHVSGTFSGTYVLERSPDGGTTWTSFNCFIAGTADSINTGTLPGMLHGNASGVTNVRVRATALASGTIGVRIVSGIGTGTITIGNPLRLYDGVNKQQATIKPASTAPAGTDTAIVTVESPNSPLIGNTANIPAKGQATMANSMPVAIASDQSTVKVKLANDISGVNGNIVSSSSVVILTTLIGVGSATVSITGTHAGVNVSFEASIDGTIWIPIAAQPIGTVIPVPVLSTGVLASNSSSAWNISPLLGLSQFRVRATAWTSGSAFVIISPSAQFTQPIVSIGSGAISTNNDATTTGSLAAASATVTTSALVGAATLAIQVSGTFVATITPSVSLDNTNWINVGATGIVNANTGQYSSTIASPGVYQINAGAFNYVRLTATSYTSGTAAITMKASNASASTALSAPLPPGSSTIGAVTLGTGSNTVGTVLLGAGTAIVGQVGLNPVTAAAGLTIFYSTSVTNTAVAIGAAGTRRMFEYDIYNPNTAGVWIQMWNLGSAPTVGTTAPTRTIYIPGSSGRDWMAGYSSDWTLGIYIAATTTNNGSTAPTSAIQVYIGYK